MSTVGGGVNIVTNGLVLYLDAANIKSYIGTGSTWSDLSRNQNNGTLVNGPTFSSQNGGSIVFDGVNDYTTCGNIFNDVMAGDGKQFTYNCAFTPQSTANQVLFGKYADSNIGAEQRQFAVIVRDLGQGFRLDVIFSTNLLGFVNVVRSNNALTLNVPNIVCITYDDNQPTSLDKVNIWINGILSPKTLAFSGQFGPIAAGTAQFGIGAQISPTGVTGFRYTGRVSTLSLYSRLLSPQEIVKNYNATKSRFELL